MKWLFASILALAVAPSAFAAPVNCGTVDILSFLTGPRHGAMIMVNNPACVGNSGWICLDPEGQHMSKETSNRLFSFLLAYHLAGKKVNVWVDTAVQTTACNGSFALLHDARSPTQ